MMVNEVQAETISGLLLHSFHASSLFGHPVWMPVFLPIVHGLRGYNCGLNFFLPTYATFINSFIR